MVEPIRVLICGSGSGAHALAAVASTKPGVEVRVLTQSTEKAQRWTQSMEEDRLNVIGRNGHANLDGWQAGSFMVTDRPEQAARGCHLIVFAVPAFAHSKYFSLLEPNIEEGSVIVGLPGQNGFEFGARKTLGSDLRNCVLMNFESLPWSCRIVEFGKTVRINGTKAKLAGAIEGDLNSVRLKDPLAVIQHILGASPKLNVGGHLLGINLMSLNAYSHPPIMYGCWKDWDGEPVDDPPLFYEGVDEYTAELLGNISNEVVATSKRIMAEFPEVDLSQVIPMYEWDIAHYGGQIRDPKNLMTSLRTNAIYKGRTHPMVETQSGQYLPDFGHRFLQEDVPCLVVIRGIAEIAGIETPNIDLVLSWGQDKINKEYLVGSKLTGKDLGDTRCPQRYGFTTIEELLH